MNMVKMFENNLIDAGLATEDSLEQLRVSGGNLKINKNIWMPAMRY